MISFSLPITSRASLADLIQVDHHQSFVDKWLHKVPAYYLQTPLSRPSWLLANSQTTVSYGNYYAISKLISAVGGGVIGWLIIAITFGQIFSLGTVVGIGVGMFLGWLVPDIYLKDRQTETELAIDRQIPEFLLLLSIILETAGHQSLISALEDTAKSISGELGQIVQQVCARKNFTTSDQVLRQLVAVCPHQLFKELAQQIELTNRYGGSVTQVVKQLADQAIQDEVIKAKEQGDKLSGLLLGPLLIFHLPALLILFLIPSVIAFTNSL